MAKLIIRWVKPLIKSSGLLGFLVLLSCATPEESVIPSIVTLPPVKVDVPIAETELNKPDPFVKARVLADILYAAKIAFDDNRLMSPADNNAYNRYLEVLSLDPGNSVAIEGIEEIVVRYVELSDEALRVGKYDYAERMLNKAHGINANSHDVTLGLQRLEEARKTKVDFFTLDSEELKQQSTIMLVRLSEIAEHVRQVEATFLITARTDSEGRWIYKVMRESVGGYRLRGNIELGLEPGVQVNIPRS